MKSSSALIGLAGLGVVAYLVRGAGASSSVLATAAIPDISPNPEGLVWYGADPSWSNWSANAICWLKKMGYAPAWMGATLVPTGINPTGHMIVRDSACMKTYTPAAGVPNPATPKNVTNALKSVPNVYYHLAHGDYSSVQSATKEWIMADDFYAALPNAKGKFAFLGSCGAFDEPNVVAVANSLVGSHILPEAFIKAYETVVGYKNIPAMSDWTVSLEWQDVMFSQLAAGETVEYACRYAAGETGSSAEQVPEMMGHYQIAGNMQNRLVEV